VIWPSRNRGGSHEIIGLRGLGGSCRIEPCRMCRRTVSDRQRQRQSSAAAATADREKGLKQGAEGRAWLRPEARQSGRYFPASLPEILKLFLLPVLLSNSPAWAGTRWNTIEAAAPNYPGKSALTGTGRNGMG